eukprot:874380-Ditylum_brightwellii.AAC.1
MKSTVTVVALIARDQITSGNDAAQDNMMVKTVELLAVIKLGTRVLTCVQHVMLQVQNMVVWTSEKQQAVPVLLMHLEMSLQAVLWEI